MYTTKSEAASVFRDARRIICAKEKEKEIN